MRWSLLQISFSLTCLLAAAASFELQGRVIWNDACKDYSTLGHSKVFLDDGRYHGSIRKDGAFEIPDVAPGSYVLSVNAHDHVFDSLRVDVPPPTVDDAIPDVRPYVPGTPHSPPSIVSLSYPITLIPRQQNIYFVEHQAFNALGMLQNPMMLLMIGAGVLMVGMPYILKNLDPEMAKEVGQRQANFANIQSSLQSGDLRGGFSSLLAMSEPDPSPETPGPAQSSNTNISKKHAIVASAAPKSKGSAGAKGRKK